ncbi:MAG: DUF1643 domain-containing protein [Propionibacteriales bacterium]|nr:DUF1643 domain-containing protein [Propionibacteriales bacterium]
MPRPIPDRALVDGVPGWIARFLEPRPHLLLTTATSDAWGAASAVFSPDEQHRYLLSRTWDAGRPPAVFVMLNPSTATAEVFDPTVRRCAGFARSWGAGGLVVANIFALRATNPRELYDHADPNGPDNDAALSALPPSARHRVAAWGNHGRLGERGAVVVGLLGTVTGPVLECLGTTKTGHPRHPLYVPATTALRRYPADD